MKMGAIDIVYLPQGAQGLCADWVMLEVCREWALSCGQDGGIGFVVSLLPTPIDIAAIHLSG